MPKDCGCTENMRCVKCQTVIYEWVDSDEEETMELDNKIQAIVEFSTDGVIMNSGLHDEFFEHNDLGIPLAISSHANLCTVNDAGIRVIEETFQQVCVELNIDPNKNYRDYDEMIEEAAKE